MSSNRYKPLFLIQMYLSQLVQYPVQQVHLWHHQDMLHLDHIQAHRPMHPALQEKSSMSMANTIHYIPKPITFQTQEV